MSADIAEYFEKERFNRQLDEMIELKTKTENTYNRDIFKRYFDEVSRNKKLDFNKVIHNPNVGWSRQHLSYNDNITTDIILKFHEHGITHLLDFAKLTRKINVQFIMSHLNFSWDWCQLSKNIDLNFIVLHKTFNWSWLVISRRDDLTLGFYLNCCEYINLENIVMDLCEFNGDKQNYLSSEIVILNLCAILEQNENSKSTKKLNVCDAVFADSYIVMNILKFFQRKHVLFEFVKVPL